jgi:hypothetical protein
MDARSVIMVVIAIVILVKDAYIAIVLVMLVKVVIDVRDVLVNVIILIL